MLARALLLLTGILPSRSLLPSPLRVRRASASARVTLSAQADEGTSSGIVPTVLHTEMADSYMSYAMSVIMSRALPDVRDGLKPVHRRILFAMHELNLQPNQPHRKCARVVGEVLGKYHPHGDSSVYDALLAALAADALLADVAEDTVDFNDNFDGSEREPAVLPAKLPMLLLNGATGIAVGMATNCPPHNLGELVDGLQLLIDEPDASDDALYAAIPAPDFPTGGIVMGTGGARQMYGSGRGSVVIRGAAHVEPATRGGGREAVVVTEMPYGVAKNTMLERIASMVNEKKLEGIAEIRDESSMEGLRIVFEIKRDSDPNVVLNNMYKRTPLQNGFAGNLMAVVGAGRMPEQLTLRSALLAFLTFRVECLERRCRHRLARAEARLHVVEGLLVAQAQMDGVVASIRAATNAAEARTALEGAFGLSERQAEAILSMQLRRLTGLERSSLQEEGATLQATSADLSALLSDRSKVYRLIHDELSELKAKYATPRRTQLGLASDADLEEINLTANERCILIRTFGGYIKRLPLHEFDAQQRGTRGKAGMSNLKDGDAVVQLEQCMTHDVLLCLSDAGVAYALPAYRVPESSRTSRGVLVHSLLPMRPEEAVATVLPVSAFSSSRYLLLLTRHGFIKKTALHAFEKITARGLIAVSLGEGDALVRASLCDATESVLLCSACGQATLFEASEEQLRASGRQSRGVKSMRMGEGDTIADMFVVPSGNAAGAADAREAMKLIAVTRCGFGKRMSLDNFRAQKRGGKGVIAMKFKRDDDRLLVLSPSSRDPADDELLLITQKGTIVRQRLVDVAEQSRSATGVKLQRLDADDLVASVSIVPASEEDDVAADSEADGDAPPLE